MSKVIEASGGIGDRLSVHFSGHGIMAHVDHIDEPAIVPEDFTPSGH